MEIGVQTTGAPLLAARLESSRGGDSLPAVFTKLLRIGLSDGSEGGGQMAAFPRVKVCAVHAASVFLDRDGSVEKACRIIEEAGREGAQLIAFPETFIPGYPFWIWTHTPAKGAPLFFDFFTNSVEVPSPATDTLCQAAKRAGAYVVIGISERDGSTLYNTQLYISDEGKIIGRHRKLQPTAPERTVWGQGDGSDIFVVDTPFGKLGGLICWEHTMDLVRYALTCLGEQIHVAAWPGISALKHDPNSSFFDDVTEAAARHHALAGQTFVINVQSCIDEDVIRRLGLEHEPDMIRTGGGWSAIIAPNGQILAGPQRDEEGLLYAELDLANIVYLKYACDSAGHYARPDVVRLQLDQSPQPVFERFRAFAGEPAGWAAPTSGGEGVPASGGEAAATSGAEAAARSGAQ